MKTLKKKEKELSFSLKKEDLIAIRGGNESNSRAHTSSGGTQKDEIFE